MVPITVIITLLFTVLVSAFPAIPTLDDVAGISSNSILKDEISTIGNTIFKRDPPINENPICVNLWQLDYCTQLNEDGVTCGGCKHWVYEPGYDHHVLYGNINVHCIQAAPELNVHFMACKGYDCKHDTDIKSWKNPNNGMITWAPDFETTRLHWADGWEGSYLQMQAGATDADDSICVNKWKLFYCDAAYDPHIGMCGGKCTEWKYCAGLPCHSIPGIKAECVYADWALEVEFVVCHDGFFHGPCSNSPTIGGYRDLHNHTTWNTPDSNYIEWRDGWESRDSNHNTPT